jgi:hypothetical protein
VEPGFRRSVCYAPLARLAMTFESRRMIGHAECFP